MTDAHPRLLERYRWLAYVLPLAVYMLAGTLEPSPPEPLPEVESSDPQQLEARRQMLRDSGSRRVLGVRIRYEHYPIVYTAKIVLTVAALAFVWPVLAQLPVRVSWLAFAVGAVGIVVWVGLCQLNLEHTVLKPLGLAEIVGLGERPGYNPLEQLKAYPVWSYVFVGVRFFGLVVVVPIIEESFYRAFLMRYVMAPDWWNVPFGQVNRAAVLIGTLLPAAAHPAEIFAAIAWFGMVTWLMTRTKSFWDCVVAHGVTNLLLGIYVMTYGEWQLW